MLICRGCCCGTSGKHPDVDHAGHLEAIAAVARTRVVDCVDECKRSNVVIVRPGDGTTLWFGGMLDTATNDELCDWLAAGAQQPLPDRLAPRVFTRRSVPVQIGRAS
ncbi:MAG: (2Fe-2S) ferredoxin domain-containing protein [Acidimicrobiia bacterium]